MLSGGDERKSRDERKYLNILFCINDTLFRQTLLCLMNEEEYYDYDEPPKHYGPIYALTPQEYDALLSIEDESTRLCRWPVAFAEHLISC